MSSVLGASMQAVRAGSATSVPDPQAGPAPCIPAAPAAVVIDGDRIGVPRAQALSAPHAHVAASPSAALPVLVAAGLIGGGVALALPSLDVTAAGVVAGARTLGVTLEHTRTFATTGLRDFAATYRAGVEHVRGLKLDDPHVLGETLGRQAWTSTEEVVRSTITGATIGASAWAAQHLCAAVADAITHRAPHDAER